MLGILSNALTTEAVIDSHQQLLELSSLLIAKPTREVVLTYIYGQLLVLLTFYALFERKEPDPRIDQELIKVRDCLIQYYDTYKNQKFKLSVPLLENIGNSAALLEALPRNSQFFSTCVQLFGAGLPMIYNPSSWTSSLKKIGIILLSKIKGWIIVSNRRKQGEEFLKSYEMTSHILRN